MLLTLKEVADRLQVNIRTLRLWIKDGKISGVKMPNGEWRFREEALNKWLDKRTVKATVI